MLETLEEGQADLQEIVKLGAFDGIFFSRTFFPTAARQEAAEAHRDLWTLLDDPSEPYVAAELFRGSGKTTTTRMYTARRIAYGISRAIVFCSETQGHAARSVRWLKRQLKHNTRLRDTFHLRPGDEMSPKGKWTDDEIEIWHGLYKCLITVVAVGITGQVRGLNFDEWRPDLIVVDDPCNEENTNTPEQRDKTNQLFFGGLKPGLAPRSDCEHSKMVLLQTSLNPDDLINNAHKDPEWKTIKVSILTAKNESVWPARWTTAEVFKMRDGYAARRQMHIWKREYECTIISKETCAFDGQWLKYYDIEPDNLLKVITIDPASTESKNSDFNAIEVWGLHRQTRRRYLLEYYVARTANPDEVIENLFRFVRVHRSQLKAVGVETIGYQKVLQHYILKAMRERNFFFPLEEYGKKDRRRKEDRIIQSFAGTAQHGMIYVKKEHVEFIDQFVSYPDVNHDDLLDAGAVAQEMMDAAAVGEYIDGDYEVLESEYESLEYVGGAP